MNADELDAMMAQFTNEELLAAFANRYRGLVLCYVDNNPMAKPSPRVIASSILEAKVLTMTLVRHVQDIEEGKVKPDVNRPDGLKRIL